MKCVIGNHIRKGGHSDEGARRATSSTRFRLLPGGFERHAQWWMATEEATGEGCKRTCASNQGNSTHLCVGAFPSVVPSLVQLYPFPPSFPRGFWY